MDNENLSVAVAPFQDAGDAESGSSALAESMSNWSDRIPPEVLSMIFEKLVSIPCRKSTNKRKRIQKSLLNCRLVHPRWKSVMDSLLESKICVKHWKRFEIAYEDELVKYAYDDLWNLQVISTERDFMLEWVLCPPSISDRSSSANPFPSKALTVSYNSAAKVVENCQPMGVVKFFSQFGHHLTCLSFSSVTIDPENLPKILEHTPHLKALTFSSVEIPIDPMDLSEIRRRQRRRRFHRNKNNYSISHLPPLPHLEHVNLLNCYITSGEVRNNVEVNVNIDDAMYLCRLIVMPYIKQLVTLKTSIPIDVRRDPTPFTFKKLTHLSTWYLEDLLMLTTANYPQLQYLCLGDVDKGNWKRMTLEKVQQCLARFANTLVELHLAIFTSIQEGEFNNTRVLQYSENQEDNEHRWSRTQTFFLKLKTFSIYYPHDPEEVEALKDMLKYMPELETLNLLRFRSDFENGEVFSEEEKETAREHVEQERYWTVCPKLKKIAVRMRLMNEDIFFTGRIVDGDIIIT
ncbi:unnamed protein product [Orchesella dallaii]|uniref:F-box domain-containing protein n=1 Tax=Orchesella dallaii TaxID=48710 RepID=A0ABP1SA35_9HEXA